MLPPVIAMLSSHGVAEFALPVLECAVTVPGGAERIMEFGGLVHIVGMLTPTNPVNKRLLLKTISALARSSAVLEVLMSLDFI